jgi:hypothetical protein
LCNTEEGVVFGCEEEELARLGTDGEEKHGSSLDVRGFFYHRWQYEHVQSWAFGVGSLRGKGEEKKKKIERRDQR